MKKQLGFLDCIFSAVYSLDFFFYGSGSGVKKAASVLLKRTSESTWNTWHNCVNVLPTTTTTAELELQQYVPFVPSKS